jgi:hypothetical protein
VVLTVNVRCVVAANSECPPAVGLITDIALCSGQTRRYASLKPAASTLKKLVCACGLYLFISCDFVKTVMIKVKFHSRIDHEGAEVSRIMAVLFNVYCSHQQIHI